MSGDAAHLAIRESDIAAHENVLPTLIAWTEQGLRTALVTIVEMDGGSPRPLGAQMAVTADGRQTGYLSGGCLESAVAAEARAAIEHERNRIVRYGKGSPYIDIALPCGSGLELYIDQDLSSAELAKIGECLRNRTPFAIASNLDRHVTRVERQPSAQTGSYRQGHIFTRVYTPLIRLLLIGSGPSVVTIAQVARAAGIEVVAASPSEAVRRELAAIGVAGQHMISADGALACRPDRWTAAVLAFHEHDWEVPILGQLVHTECFYIGALGSRTVQRARQIALATQGLSIEAIARVRGPIGIIPGALSRTTLAVGVVAEVIQAAKSLGYVD